MYSVTMRSNPIKHRKQILDWKASHSYIALPRDDYQFIKAWCDAHAIKLGLWLVILAKEAMQQTDVAKMKPARKDVTNHPSGA